MPAYEYRCEECGVYEHHQKMVEKPLKKCIKCGGSKIKRLISAASVVFKGSGFHVTDYGKNTHRTEHDKNREHHHHKSEPAKNSTEKK
ncbi:hypothetical protein A2526_00890 [candidate division WOR-1 bacterium RIFOXYD2_FULL_36_8]|uniref:Putative regulatory protein FmdB zinc ribbon domain-containing protein n=1 Tax=candidate division WOR-1 bacterium RIFOXYB2_FULL_36_35 TaxID=1802578 RepID=A0A1F4S698_UNCSA|nr:MAG: hypothetical protein A2230_01455 [candidate division WOR-1 bacterium RIFOXYA2_FULL_36_21]OGC14359.1 MAG: hypothetical protein A2282_07900 [candidate division WOR-1 bacterium RIFOXYA12_FULL_36_13]OGC15965.1 MAG: hypothetical protein A2290_06925 [candidate division WOR-1 bacterium RIFOXYB2_FULL_36_35]OGC37370.1 MAG: hypothetical protein A2526_00890 [candidate division WOR-1 bacterium RIFOXYD2_FULL_36_8]